MVDVESKRSSRVAAGGAIRVGGVISQTFATAGRHWLPYLALSLVLFILNLTFLLKPYIAAQAFAPFNVVVTVLRTVVATVFQAGMTFATVRALDGERFSALGGIGVGLRRFLPYAGAAILYLLAIVGGMVLLLVPGFIAFAMLCVAPAVTVTEDAGPIAALRRSRALTYGNRWRVLAVLAVVYLTPTLFFIAVGATAAILKTTSTEQLLRQQLLIAAINLLLTPIYFALAAVLYHHLRRAEGVAGPANLAEVFT